MALTGDFKETIKARAQRDPVFRKELIKQAIQCIRADDMDTGKAVMRDYINATIGVEKLGNITHKSPKSLIQMFEPKGNPQARSLFKIISQIQKYEGV